MKASLFVPAACESDPPVPLCAVEVDSWPCTDSDTPTDSTANLVVVRYVRPPPCPGEGWASFPVRLSAAADTAAQQYWTRYCTSLLGSSPASGSKAAVVELRGASSSTSGYLALDALELLHLLLPPRATPQPSQSENTHISGEKRQRCNFTEDACSVAKRPALQHELASEAAAEHWVPRLFDDSVEDIPPLAMLRQEWLLAHRRCLALNVASAVPFAVSHKTGRAVSEHGLLSGLQGMHQRWLFQQQLTEVWHLDPLLPCVDEAVLDTQVLKEMEACGIPTATAEATLGCMNRGSNEACYFLAAADSYLRSTIPAAWTDETFGLELCLRPARGSGQGSVAISYFPSLEADSLLAEVASKYEIPEGLTAKYGMAENIFARNSRDVLGRAAPRFSSTVVINVAHYRKLRLLYAMAARGVQKPLDLPAGCLISPDSPMDLQPTELTPLDSRFLTRIFCVLARYEALSSTASGMQGAVPHEVFDGLERGFGVGHECFASPLNCHFPSFCSLFPDTDRYFGSKGNFFEFCPKEGAFESNPPFVNKVLVENAKHIIKLLEAAVGPMVFIIFAPAWGDAYYHEVTKVHAFCRTWRILKKKEHYYIDGMQHRVARAVWSANVDSFVYIMANTSDVRRHTHYVGSLCKHADADNPTLQHKGQSFDSLLDEAIHAKSSLDPMRVHKFDVSEYRICGLI